MEEIRRSKFKGLAVTALLSVICARHGLFRPKGCVDLTRGEAYVDMKILGWIDVDRAEYFSQIFVDWAMAGSLKNTEVLQSIVLSYDQACQYSVHFAGRMETRFPELKGQFVKFKYVVNKAHLPGHIDDCVQLFNPNYIEGSGRFDGEANERIWSVQNANASTTREMSSGHRRDALNDHMNWWNFMKLVHISESMRGGSVLRLISVA